MKTLYPLLTLALLGATTLAPTPAQAADSRIYPGVMCVPDSDHTEVGTHWGRVKNDSATPMWFDCGIVRDNLNSSIAGGDVWVINQNYDESLSCTLGIFLPLSGGTHGSSGFFSTRSTNVVSSAPQKLASFAALGHLADGYMMMSCTVPPKYNGKQSAVVSYRVTENSP